MDLSPDLANRVALVTGGSRGIGRAIALALAQAGAAVAVNYRTEEAAAQSVVDAIGAAGGRAIAVGADVSRGDEVARLAATAVAQLGPIDVLVNNAGIALMRGLEDLTEVLPHMRAQGGGRIVNVSSGAARGSGIVGVHYNASKAGMEGLTRGYAARLAREGVTVNAVAPTLIDTDMISARTEDSAARIPMRRLGTPEECAQATLMVIGNAYMTGQTVQVNGGMHFI